MRTYRRKIFFTIAIRHKGDKDFEKELDSHIKWLVEHNAYDAVNNVLCASVAHLVRKNGLGQSFKSIFDKIVDWALETPARGRLPR